MTSKSIYEAVLTELNKLLAPSITLEDFNYFVNKGISLYSNRKYNVYDTTLLTSDDLRVLKSSAILTPKKANVYDDDDLINLLYGNVYEVNLPDDYFHLLNCICVYQSKSLRGCTNTGEVVLYGANRLTADMWGEVMNNYYMKPSYKRPYYYLHNVNTKENSPTNPVILDNNGLIISGTDYTHGNNTSGGSTPDVNPGTPTTSLYTIYYTDVPALNPDNYKFDRNTVNSSNISNSLTVSILKQLLYLLVIPANKSIKSIIEVATGDQTAMYTNRKYKTERTEVIDSIPYQLIFLGSGNVISGQYTINFL